MKGRRPAVIDRTPAPFVASDDKATKKRRRPSGEPPALPRHLYASGKYWLALASVIVLSWAALVFIAGSGAAATRFELSLLDGIADLRTAWMTRVARAIHFLGSEWVTLGLRWGMVAALLFFKRFRHLFVLLFSILLVGLITAGVSQWIARPRPLEIEILGHWQGGAHPSRPLAALAVTLLGIAYTLIPPGRSRTLAKWGTVIVLLLVSLARLYLAVDHPSDVIAGVIIGVTIPLVAFRLWTPNDVFPVTYKKRRSAHLDVDGPRGDAIRTAVEQQLGISIVDVEQFGLGGSAGSTPLRLTVGGEPPTQLFAKLYAQNHLRADRWYKLGRTLLYGRLEDEGSFSTVRRLVQYEDYMLRVMRDAKLPTPRPYGFVEITPEREYLLIADFVPLSKELLDAEITDDMIDQCLRLIRKLWDSGIAHRDIKPSNLLVSRGEIHLIDVAFGEVRPSPWRQAVDLANMMLLLGLRRDTERVYRIALRYFTPDEIAEAFSATHGVTIPNQTRSLMKKDSRNLVADFRRFAPQRARIAIQRWSVRRAALTFGTVLTCIAALLIVFSNFRGAGLQPPQDGGAAAYSGVTRQPTCEMSDQLLLMAQSVPSASLLPCIETLPIGWSFGALDVIDGRTRLFLDSDRGGLGALDVTLTPRCDLGGASQVPSDEAGARRFERVVLRQNRYAGSRFYLFDGGCVIYNFDFSGSGRTALADEASVALSFIARETLDSELEKKVGFGL